MDNNVAYDNLHFIEMNSDHSDNDSCSDYTLSDSTESCKLIQNQNLIETDAIYRRTLNNSSDNSTENDNRRAKRIYEHEEYMFISSQKSRQSQNRSFKQFLVLFGFATSFIILLQLYLSLYYDDPMNRGMIYDIHFILKFFFFFFC